MHNLDVDVRLVCKVRDDSDTVHKMHHTALRILQWTFLSCSVPETLVVAQLVHARH